MSQELLLLISVLALALGPLSVRLLQRYGSALQFLDGFVLVSVGGIVLADVIPHAFEQIGWWALPMVLLGLLGPAMLEKGLQKAAAQVHAAALLLGLSALVLHAGMDGVALGAIDKGEVSSGLATAVVLHRVPEGLTLWWLLRPAYGARVAWGVLFLVAAATAVGMSLGGTRAELLHDNHMLAFVGALVGGSLLHVVVHRPHPLLNESRKGAHHDHDPPGAAAIAGHGHDRWHLAAGFGALAGGALLAVLFAQGHGHVEAHGTHDEPWLDGVFWALARESAPALLLAYAAAGLVQVALPAASMGWMKRGGLFKQAFRGMAFGLPLPICSCGVVPVYRSLAMQGVPPAAAIAFLVATPELGLDAVLLSIPLLGMQLAGVRLLAAAAVALGVGLAMGWLAGRLPREKPLPVPTAPVDPLQGKDVHASVPRRIAQGLRVGFGEIVDHTGPWVLLGLVVAAIAAPLLAHGDLTRMPAALQVPLFALLGMPMYVCASGATPLVAVLIAGGVSPGAGLAFLLTGPATNMSTFGVLARMHGTRTALAFAIAMAALSIAAGWIVDLVLGGYQVPVLKTDVHAEHFGVSDVALIGLGVLLVASLLRQGPRGFLGQILAFADGDGPGGHAHDHDHDGPGHGGGYGHDHGHDHARPVQPQRKHVHDPIGHGHAHHHGHDHGHGTGAGAGAGAGTGTGTGAGEKGDA